MTIAESISLIREAREWGEWSRRSTLVHQAALELIARGGVDWMTPEEIIIEAFRQSVEDIPCPQNTATEG